MREAIYKNLKIITADLTLTLKLQIKALKMYTYNTIALHHIYQSKSPLVSFNFLYFSDSIANF